MSKKSKKSKKNLTYLLDIYFEQKDDKSRTAKPTINFGLSAEQTERFVAWRVDRKIHKKCPTRGNEIGGAITFSFTNTSIGTSIVVSCVCKNEIDLSEYDNW